MPDQLPPHGLVVFIPLIDVDTRMGPTMFLTGSHIACERRDQKEINLNNWILQGKYSKRRRSNVAVIIVRIVFISLFFFYYLFLNRSFQTNPNRITNCFKLFFLLQLTTTLLLRRFLIFEQIR